MEPILLNLTVLKFEFPTLLVPFIDWSPFFRSWDLHGKFPAILTDEVVGEQASILYKEAQEMIEEIIVKKQLK